MSLSTIDENGNPRDGRRRRRRWVVLSLASILGVAALVAAAGPDHLWGHRRGFAGVHGHGSFDPEAAKEHIGLAVNGFLGQVEASEAQTDEIRTRLERAVDELASLVAGHGEHRQALRDLLQEPEIDRQALEELRAGGVRQLDEASRVLIAAVADVAEALTPEQRRQLAELHDHH